MPGSDFLIVRRCVIRFCPIVHAFLHRLRCFQKNAASFHVKFLVKTVLSPRPALLGENSAFVVGQESVVFNVLLKDP